MKNKIVFIGLMLLLAVGISFASGSKYHKTDLPDPKQFNAHFGDMDVNGDDRVDWKEFKKHFPHAGTNVFEASDMDASGSISHEEWHQFKDAHGLEHNY
jgi:hypothetical protein